MRIYKYLSVVYLLLSAVISCSDTYYKFKLNTSKKVSLGAKASISFEQVQGKVLDSVHLYLNNKRVNKNQTTVSVNTASIGVGKHKVTAIAFYPGKSKKLNNYIEVFSDKVPKVYSFEIVNTYPHDKEAYTQGLEYYKGYLYETTGQKGKSTLRKVKLETGEVIQKIKLSDSYFGEGMTIYNNKIYWLTWQSRKGFIYSLDTFKKLGEFKYNRSYEGWGLTHNDSMLIKSDGTTKIWFLDPESFKEKRNIQVYTNKVSLEKLNELELVNGKIYANYWQKPLIAIINPKNGSVEAIVNLTKLVKEMKKTQNLIDQDEVLNGIAYDKEKNRLFVTGKHWNKLFEIKILEQ